VEDPDRGANGTSCAGDAGIAVSDAATMKRVGEADILMRRARSIDGEVRDTSTGGDDRPEGNPISAFPDNGRNTPRFGLGVDETCIRSMRSRVRDSSRPDGQVLRRSLKAVVGRATLTTESPASVERFAAGEVGSPRDEAATIITGNKVGSSGRTWVWLSLEAGAVEARGRIQSVFGSRRVDSTRDPTEGNRCRSSGGVERDHTKSK
jgi:hypothetical protein